MAVPTLNLARATPRGSGAPTGLGERCCPFLSSRGCGSGEAAPLWLLPRSASPSCRRLPDRRVVRSVLPAGELHPLDHPGHGQRWGVSATREKPL